MKTLKSKHKIIALIGIALLVILAASPVLAQTYYAVFTVAETGGTSYSTFPAMLEVENEDVLVDGHYMRSDGLDTRVETTSGTELPHMVSSYFTNFVTDLPAYTNYAFHYILGDTTLDSTYIIPGYDGWITVPDNAALEPGNAFTFEIKGYVDTSSGSNKNLVYKDSAFIIYVSAALNIKAEITGGTSVTATAIESGEHTVKVVADATNLYLYIDTILRDSSALGGVGVPDNANPWLFIENNVMPYVEYIKETT